METPPHACFNGTGAIAGEKRSVGISQPGRKVDDDGAAADRLYADLMSHLERGDDLASLTSVLLAIEALPPDCPRRSGLREAAHQAIALCQRMQQYQQKERALRAVFEIAQGLTELKNLDDVLLDIVRRGRKLLGSDIAWLAGEDSGTVHVLAIDGANTHAAREMSGPSTAGIAGYVARTASAFTTNDYLADPQIAHDSSIDATLAREGMKSAIAVPLLSDSEVIGVLILGDRYNRAHQPWEVSILATLAAHASVAIRNARIFEAKEEALRQVESANAYLQEKVSELELAAEAHDRIARQLSRRGSLDEMAAIIADMLRGEVVFMDPAGRELCVAPSPDLPARPVRQRTSPPRLDPALLIAAEKSREAGRSVPLPADGAKGAFTRIVAASGGDDLLGSLIIRTATPLSDHQIRIFERGSTAMAVLVLLAEKEHASERQDVNLTVRALLDESRHASKDVAEYAKQHGLDLDAPILLAVVEVERAKLAYVGRRLNDRLRFHSHILTEIDGRIVVLVNRSDPAGLKQELERTVFAELMATGAASVSPPLEGAAALCGAYAAALRAISLMHKLKRVDQVVYEPELSIYAILFQQHGAAEIARMIEAAVGPLLAHDARRGTRLADTLLAFLDNRQNARVTARRLGIHVNTVHNRIETIRRLIGPLDRDGPDVEMHLALRLRQLHGA